MFLHVRAGLADARSAARECEDYRTAWRSLAGRLISKAAPSNSALSNPEACEPPRSGIMGPPMISAAGAAAAFDISRALPVKMLMGRDGGQDGVADLRNAR